VVTILEGESLVNDASALIAYKYAVAAVTTGTFVFWEAGLQLYLAASTLHFIETDLQGQLNNNSELRLKKKYEHLIINQTRELRRHKKAKHNDEVKEVTPPDALVNAKLEISKFQRALLLKIYKEGEFSDTVIRQVESEPDTDELKIYPQVPKEG
jgi:hypothetical protein